MFLTHTKQQLKVYTSVYTVNLLPRDVINHHVIYHTIYRYMGGAVHAPRGSAINSVYRLN